MKILKIKIKNFAFYDEQDIIIDFTPAKRVSSNNNEEIISIAPNIQTFNIFAMYGMNASGKTTLLKIIQFVYELYMNNKSVEEIRKDILFINPNICFECMFICGNTIYNTYINIEGNMIVDEEIIYFDKKEIKTKKMLGEYAFLHNQKLITKYFEENNTNIVDREAFSYYNSNIIIESISKIKMQVDSEHINYSTYMKNEFIGKKSIVQVLLLENKDDANVVISTIKRTNLNLFTFPEDGISEETINAIAKLLDNNIQYIKLNTAKNREADVTIKFENQEPFNCKYANMEDYLSAGTIRGLNLFQKALRVLKNGGIFLVDEIDLNLNLALVEQIILLFKNRDYNKNDATLIFTTHVPTLLDLFERDDNILILNKLKKNTSISKLSSFELRYDKVKSNSLISGELDTNPNYDSFVNILNCSKVLNG